MPFATKAIRERVRRRLAAQVRAGEPCALCGQPIDLRLLYPHPDSFTVDHVVPSSLGGSDHLEQCRPAHNRCNRTKSALPAGTVGVNSAVLERDPAPRAVAPPRGASAPVPRHGSLSGAPNDPRPARPVMTDEEAL